MSALETISVEVINIFIFSMEVISGEARKISVLAFARFRRDWVVDLRKKVSRTFHGYIWCFKWHRRFWAQTNQSTLHKQG